MPKESAIILDEQGYRVEYRGLVPVKGKGEMETYYVLGKKIERSKSVERRIRNPNSSLEAVITAMVQRKKQTLGSSLSVPSTRQRISVGPSSLSFNLKMPRSAQRLQRILSENPNSRAKRSRSGERRMTDTSSQSFPDVTSQRRGSKKTKDDVPI